MNYVDLLFHRLIISVFNFAVFHTFHVGPIFQLSFIQILFIYLFILVCNVYVGSCVCHSMHAEVRNILVGSVLSSFYFFVNSRIGLRSWICVETALTRAAISLILLLSLLIDLSSSIFPHHSFHLLSQLS